MAENCELFKRWTSGQPWFVLIKVWVYNSFASCLDPELLLTLNSGNSSATVFDGCEINPPNISRILQEVRMMELADLKINILYQRRELNILREDLQLLKNELLAQEKVENNKRKIVKISDYSLEDIFMDDDSFCSTATGYFSTVSANEKNNINSNKINNGVSGNKLIDNIGLNLKIIQK
ncbi:hypothetical protein, no similarity [Maudiozyma saulgeensis]|uniref:Uncharacterized protein n=1 Tax=Maudiozyma saulgeensis TaxID=1789683 RepID=A0A1X7QZ32_9SACH|nr:hypothetical protein, no similarity [Kazachstania saulgeensis]